MIGILLSKVLGFVRQLIISNIFGLEGLTDAFYAAFTIPDLLFNMLIGGTISAAFIPVFTSLLVKDKEEEGWSVASNFINIIIVSIMFFTLLGMIFTPLLVSMVAYKFEGERLDITIKLTRIMLSGVLFTCLSGLGIGILQSYNRFIVAVLGPVIYNVGIIISLLSYKYYFSSYGIEVVAYGVVISSLIHFIIHFAALFNKIKFYKFKINVYDPEIKRIFKLAIPSIIGLSIIQLNFIITQNFASALPVGSITAFKYSNTIMLLPVGIIGMGIAQAIFPTLATQVTLNKLDDFRQTFSLGLRTVFFINIPASVGLLILREPIVRLLYSSGRFTEENVRITAYALLFFTLSIAFQAGIQILTRGYYSINDTITPVKVGGVTVLLNVILNYMFINYLYLEYPVGSLIFASSISIIFNMVALAYIFNKKMGGINTKKIIISVTKTSIASLIMGMIIYFGYAYIQFNISSKIGQLIQVSTLMTFGILVFVASVFVLKMEEAYYFLNIIKNRLKLK